jgi:HK97 gp10 family phage protein
MSVLVTGLEEAKAVLDKLPETMTAALKAQAKATADRILDGYRQRILAQTKAHKTAASARVLDESDEKQFTVNVPGHPDDPANLSRWLEYGTRHMVAKPSLRPAGDAEHERYKAEMAAIAERTMREAIE